MRLTLVVLSVTKKLMLLVKMYINLDNLYDFIGYRSNWIKSFLNQQLPKLFEKNM